VSAEPMIFHDRTDGNYQVIFTEPGTDATYDLSLYGGLNTVSPGTIASSLTESNTGPASILCNGNGDNNGSAYATTRDFGVDIKGGGRVSFYFKLSGLPSSDSTKFGPKLLVLDRTSAAQTAYLFRINTSGTIDIMVWNDSLADAIVVATSVDAITLNAWQRFSVSWRIVNRYINECRVFLDGNLKVSVSNIDLLKDSPQIGRLSYGMYLGGWGGGQLRLDDLYVDNNDTLQDTGDIHVTAKLPASNYVNNFGTNIGNNPSNRYENVNERPIATANGWQENSGGPYPIDEAYGIQAKGVGDVDLSSYSGNYPDINPMIGIRTTYTGGVNLYECGMIVAYNEDTTRIMGFLPWANLSSVTGADAGNNDVFLWANSATFNLSQQVTVNTATVTLGAPIIPAQRPFRFYSTTDEQPFIFSSRS
jgi:hypothetical protein